MSEQADNNELPIEEVSELGRIEVIPEVLLDIVAQTALLHEGVAELATLPADATRRTKRSMRQDGVTLVLDENGAIFDLYLLMQPHVNFTETGRAIQAASIDAVDKMVGISVQAVNIHIEDVIYAPDSAD